MKQLFFLFVFLFVACFPLKGYAQKSAVDSLKILLKAEKGKRKAELNLEIAKCFLKDELDSSQYYNLIARRIAIQYKDHVTEIRSYSAQGEVYQRKNLLKASISSYLKGLKLAEQYQEHSLAGTIYNGLGVCYFNLNDIKKAEQYMKLAANEKRKAKDYQYFAIISTNLAGLQIMQQSFDQSIKTLKEAEKTLIKNKQEHYLSTVYNSLGAAYQSVQPDSCEYYYNRSLFFANKYKDVQGKMNVLQNLGDFYFGQKKIDLALKYMKQAIAVNALRPEDAFKPALYRRISSLYDSIKDYKNAYHFKKLESEAYERIFSIEKQKEIEELEIKYESEKKERLIQQGKQALALKSNQQYQLIFGGIALFMLAGFVTYIFFQKRKIERAFEQEKLKLFENIFHELRTPITLIAGPIQILKQSLKDAEEIELLERNTNRLVNLVDELLDSAKLGKGSFQLTYVNGAVQDFIEQVALQFEQAAQNKSIQLIIEKNDNSTFHAFPSNVLDKILTNLIGNAIKYSPEKSTVRVKSSIQGNFLTITIADDGPGIPKNDQKKVFRRFYRGKQTKHIAGTGIGLSLVKEMVDLVQGSIEMKSDSSGTTFTLELPLNAVEQVLEDPILVENPDKPLLLLVEDDADTAQFTLSILKHDFALVHLKNGQQAIDFMQEQLPDIVLSDVMMPEKDGVTLLQEVRSNELLNHLPFILFSAKSALENRLKGLKLGADGYISKPFAPEELIFTLKNVLETIERNKQAYSNALKTGTTFEERIKSNHAYVNKVISFIVQNMEDANYSVNELASDLAVSRSQLHRKLVALTNYSTTNFIRMIRLEKAKDMLLRGDGNITEIAYKCGFNSQSYFTKSFTEYVGKSPSQLIEKS